MCRTALKNPDFAFHPLTGGRSIVPALPSCPSFALAGMAAMERASREARQTYWSTTRRADRSGVVEAATSAGREPRKARSAWSQISFLWIAFITASRRLCVPSFWLMWWR